MYRCGCYKTSNFVYQTTHFPCLLTSLRFSPVFLLFLSSLPTRLEKICVFNSGLRPDADVVSCFFRLLFRFFSRHSFPTGAVQKGEPCDHPIIGKFIGSTALLCMNMFTIKLAITEPWYRPGLTLLTQSRQRHRIASPHRTGSGPSSSRPTVNCDTRYW